MTNLLKSPYFVPALLGSAGCYGLLVHWSDLVVYLCFLQLLAPSPSDIYRAVSRREIVIFINVLWTLLIVIVTSQWFLPTPVAAGVLRVLHHPAFVLPFWILLQWGFYRIYHRPKTEVDA